MSTQNTPTTPAPDANAILYNGTTPTGIYVGASSAVSSSNAAWFAANNINAVLNVAFDTDDAVFNNTPQNEISTILFAKVGLIDTGPNPGYNTTNNVQTMIAAVYMLDQLMTRNGGTSNNVLVHCCSGGSRSVAVAALWMAQRLLLLPVAGQTRFETALNAVRSCRNFGTIPYDPTNPNARPDPSHPCYNDGKPMAAHFYMCQSIDQSMNLFPAPGVTPPVGWPSPLVSSTPCGG